MSLIQQIKQKIIDEDYLLSSHAEEELKDDDLTIYDLENAVLKGFIEKKLTKDYRGVRYRIEGPSLDGRIIHVICRFKEVSNLLIITVYALEVKFYDV